MNSKTLKYAVGIAVITSIILYVKLLYGDQQESPLSEEETTAQDNQHYTTKEAKDGLILYYPDYTNIDLVCSTMPSVKDKRVIFCAEAAFTGELLKEFKHSNILGDHVSGGVRYKGSGCKRNTGAFIYYDQHWQFLYKDYSKELDVAARNGGMGFGQEMMIHNGTRVQTIRKDSNKNKFRALCELNGRLCIIDSKGVSIFGDFIQNLLGIGVTEACIWTWGPAGTTHDTVIIRGRRTKSISNRLSIQQIGSHFITNNNTRII